LPPCQHLTLSASLQAQPPGAP